jgi:ferredoxin-NADP reductase
MIKELHFKASHGSPPDGVQYTLLHANRTTEELGYHEDLLRHLLGMPPKEQQGLVAPVLPRHIAADDVRQRLEAGRTVILTCGNPSLMADIKYIADSNQIRFEKEDW